MRINYNKPRTNGYVGVSFSQPEEDYNYGSSVKKFYDEGIDDNAVFNKRSQDSSDSFNKPYKPDSLNGEYSQTPYFIAKWCAYSLMVAIVIIIYNHPYKTFLLCITVGLIITLISQVIGFLSYKKTGNRL